MALNICSNNHEEVCFEGGYRTSCPACSALVKMQEEYEKQIEELEKKLSDVC